MDCSYDWQNGQVDAGKVNFDPDIVGIGVILSFIFTAAIAFVVVIAGYLTYSLSDKLVSRADDEIVNDLRGVFDKVTLHFFSHRLRWFNAAKIPEDEDDPVRQARIQGLVNFMLIISDQQLVTGFAMLIAGFARYSDMTIYSINVLSGLAFFSSMVHLDTLDIILESLKTKHIVKSLRVGIMMFTLAGLILLLVLQTSAEWYVDNVYFRCGLSDFTLVGADPIDIATSVYVILFLVFSYIDPVFSMYSRHDTITESALMRWKQIYRHSHVTDSIILEYSEKVKQLLANRQSQITMVFREFTLLNSFGFHEAQNTKAWTISNLTYGMVYGTTQVFVYRASTNGTTGAMNTMGFGQIVPLALLLLPIFAAIEGIYGYQQARREFEQSTTESQPQKSSASAMEMVTFRYGISIPVAVSSLGQPPLGSIDRRSVSTTDSNKTLTQVSESSNASQPCADDQKNVGASTGFSAPPRRPTIMTRRTESVLRAAIRALNSSTEAAPKSSTPPKTPKDQMPTPLRQDTVSLERTQTLEDLLDATPDSTFTRFLRGDPRKLPSVKAWMYFWLGLAYVTQILMGISSAGLLPELFLPMTGIYLAMEARAWFRFISILIRVRREGTKKTSNDHANN